MQALLRTNKQSRELLSHSEDLLKPFALLYNILALRWPRQHNLHHFQALTRPLQALAQPLQALTQPLQALALPLQDLSTL
jgi:hypothetical protein